jgi:hypothetical protein
MPDIYNDLSGLTPEKPFLFLIYTATVCTVRWSWELNGVMSTDTVFELNSYPRDDGHLHKIGT